MIRSPEDLRQSAIQDEEPPEELAPALRALWLAKAGRWEESHDVAQNIDSRLGSWIHAHLHRIEGDLGNAGYWYRRAGRDDPASAGAEALDREWLEIAAAAMASEPGS